MPAVFTLLRISLEMVRIGQSILPLLWAGGLGLVAGTTRGDVSTAPALGDSDSVQFYVIESSFPYNAPANIQEMAGESFEKYGITHAGIGVWDTTSDQKFTIEFISEDYVGALLPDFDDDTQSLVWKNQGQVVFTVPTSNKNWLNSQLICDTSGVAYNQLVTYIEDNIDLFASFQPVEVVYYNASLLSNATEYTNTELDKSGHLKVAKTDSFFFVNKIVHLLTDYGADTESFLQIYGTAYQYISRYNEAAGVVSWSADGPANTEVYQWYQALSACYQDVYDATVNNGEGAEYFLDAVKECYGGRAYVYLSDTSVYNVTLGNLTRTYSTPNLQRYIFDLPGDADNNKHPLQAIDILVIVVVTLAVAGGIWVIVLRTCCYKKQRRHVSMEGERMAKRVVDNIAGEHLHDDHEQKVYYRGKPTYWTRMWNYLNGRGELRNVSSSNNVGRSEYVSDTQHPNSNDSDPSSDLVKPLAAQRLTEEYSNDMSYMSRVAQSTAGAGGYVSPVMVPGGPSPTPGASATAGPGTPPRQSGSSPTPGESTATGAGNPFLQDI